MEFTKPFYNLISKDGLKVTGEAWDKGVRYFMLENGEVIPSPGSEVTCQDAIFDSVPAERVIPKVNNDRLMALEQKVKDLEAKL